MSAGGGGKPGASGKFPIGRHHFKKRYVVKVGDRVSRTKTFWNWNQMDFIEVVIKGTVRSKFLFIVDVEWGHYSQWGHYATWTEMHFSWNLKGPRDE